MSYWIFDLDGTLVDSFSHYFRLLEVIFMQFGKRFTPDLQSSALTTPLVSFFATHLGPENVDAAFQLLQKQSNDDAREIQIFPGLEPLISHFVKRGDRLGIWTNRDRESASLIVKHSGLAPLVEIFVTGTCVTQRKPHPEGLLKIIKHFGCNPSEVIMVGDHEHDVTAAKEVGARAIRASWHGNIPLTPCNVSDHQFYSVSEFENWARNPHS
jgi:HAD superfamily hydrolase (TIGR01662 family)